MVTSSSKVSVCIPARQGSTRFPGKPLAKLAGKPLIQHVYESVINVPYVGQVLVVTDHDEILQTVQRFGGEGRMVIDPCRTGTDRIAKVSSHLSHNIVVNLQADEILLDPDLLSDLIQPFLDSEAEMGTLKRKLSRKENRGNPSIVKIVADQRGRALYFSRSAIPCWRDGVPQEVDDDCWMHLGIYIFQKEALQRFSELPTGYLEDAEKLEQLRALEHGMSIRVWETKHDSLRIDSPEDLHQAELWLAKNLKAGAGESGKT